MSYGGNVCESVAFGIPTLAVSSMFLWFCRCHKNTGRSCVCSTLKSKLAPTSARSLTSTIPSPFRSASTLYSGSPIDRPNAAQTRSRSSSSTTPSPLISPTMVCGISETTNPGTDESISATNRLFIGSPDGSYKPLVAFSPPSSDRISRSSNVVRPHSSFSNIRTSAATISPAVRTVPAAVRSSLWAIRSPNATAPASDHSELVGSCGSLLKKKRLIRTPPVSPTWKSHSWTRIPTSNRAFVASRAIRRGSDGSVGSFSGLSNFQMFVAVSSSPTGSAPRISHFLTRYWFVERTVLVKLVITAIWRVSEWPL